MDFTVECEPRNRDINPRQLRRTGQIPVVLYGHKKAESVSLSLPTVVAERMLAAVEVNNTLVEVKVPELSLKCVSLLRDVQTHPWKGELYHLSFFAISGQDNVTITAPLNLVGEPVGVKNENGSLDVVLTSLELQCDPQNIPESIEVDISSLKVGDAIHVKELKLPKGVVSEGEEDRVVASVLPPAGTTTPSDDTPSDSEISADTTEADTANVDE
ncbi:50S ribosomal protein L25/general stress protein Ctc [Acaryochloris sp. IP29b_bin.137]|uniref:50S ribosomal protein L25/general stress protein Ctc n=1 Tax=Acaryochloris sp. IP29b_bin.137 TaxID=2969217 RepID=UPI0026191E38|nr:50S ribosomal protein L25/general stress protein Ctc [Acaryochloris sp. IP29b_bin.137]